MKSSFTTIDVIAVVAELKNKIVGLRVVQVYDIDHKTYLVKLQKPEQKCVLLLESAARIHTTDYEWPKNPAPSSFAMKLRKHVRNKRIENIEQLGIDRVVDITFGSGEIANHIIIELYDRGNIVLTDHNYVILNVLRPRKEGEDVRLASSEKYPLEKVRKAKDAPSRDLIKETIEAAKPNAPLKKILNPLLDCGGGMIDHELQCAGFIPGSKLVKDPGPEYIDAVHNIACKAQATVTNALATFSQGYIIYKSENRTTVDGSSEQVQIYQEYLPLLYSQHSQLPHTVFDTFNQACDEFFSKLEAIKIDTRAMQQEKEALKKLENVKKDHERRLQALHEVQENDRRKGQLIELNKELVESAIKVVLSAVANQIDWNQIKELISEAQAQGDQIASAIRAIKLETNQITVWLSDPYDQDEDDFLLDSDEEREEGHNSEKMRPMPVDIQLDKSALANARRYYDQKRQAAKKEQKTIDASAKAFKSAEKKTRQTLKEVAAITSINKARKVHWFEKFLWFISSENFLVIGGRDAQQNEMVVKRHLYPQDVYVHSDMHGASSIIIKNPGKGPVPPKTLHEAGIMAMCYSRAWDEKVVTSAWWVWGDQVSKTAPTGEYLTTGSFMVRGKKNFLPPSHLVYGFGFLFRLEESSVFRHIGERKVRNQEEDSISTVGESIEDMTITAVEDEDQELFEIEEDKDDESDKIEEKLSDILSENIMEKQCNSDEKLAEFEKGKSNNLIWDKDSKHNEKEEYKNEEGKSSKYEKEESKNTTGPVEFPDTVIEMAHIKGDQFAMRTRTVSTVSSTSETSEAIGDTESQVVYLGDDKPVVIKPKVQKNNPVKGNQKKPEGKPKSKNSKIIMEEDGLSKTNMEVEMGLMKRGQRSKVKKMKEKYRHQDEEERQMRMELLQSAGNNKGNKKSKDVKREKGNIGSKGNKTGGDHQVNKDVQDKPIEKARAQKIDDDDEDEVGQVLDDLSILDTLTANPVTEDELLYAIPVCAPYPTMTNYKFKVKMTPGTGKKGKACKTAMAHFLTDKSCSGREKDLFKSVKDQDLARNLPGKVKVAVSQSSKSKK
ncbi:nuclear export mediator factor NEMF homolog Clbn [Oratosquilla oratoria]|uniref:nuclear export mediator factor NEMF homolog Clbn n=1 Tax=Oratosquilla oratoria TaxID=337810 RepID=UPI003F75AAB2